MILMHALSYLLLYWTEKLNPRDHQALKKCLDRISQQNIDKY